MVSPGTCRCVNNISQSIPPQSRLDGLGDITAAATSAGPLVDLRDELLRQHQVCAHIHAHTIAHSSGGVNDQFSGATP